jgi:ribonuclease HI
MLQSYYSQKETSILQLAADTPNGGNPPPPANVLKVNVDGAFLADADSGAVGAVARNDVGEFVMAMNKQLPVVASPLAAEVEALRAGAQMIHTVTQEPVIMETDSLELVGL